MPENADAWELWKLARNQWHVGFDGPVRLDYCAVETIAERLEIDITPCMLKKLEALEAYMLDYWRRRRDENGKRH